MPEHADDGADVVALRPRLGRRWMIPGGDEDDGGITLHVVVSDEEGLRTRRYAVRIPLEVVGEFDLSAGEPDVVDADAADGQWTLEPPDARAARALEG